MPLRALVFDLWGTLVEDSVVREEPRRLVRVHLVCQALAVSRHPYTEETVAGAFEAYNKWHGALVAEGRDVAWPERLERFLEHLEPGLARRLPPAGRRAVDEALVGAIRHHPPLPAPGAHDVLEEARRRGLGVGLVSNTGITPGYVLRALLAESGLLAYLQALTFSDEACLAKPAPEMFLCTLEALRVAPANAVFVGDMPHADLAGALAVGMWAVQMGDKQLNGVQPHARIDALPELFGALEGLGIVAG